MSINDPVIVKRECNAVEIPAGTQVTLQPGDQGRISQMLGGSFTIQMIDGRLLRVDGLDADAIGQEVPAESKPPVAVSLTGEADMNQIWDTMKTCYDPEIPVNIVELGLIYGCETQPHPEGGSIVKVIMTLTAPGCGMSDVLKSDLESKIGVLPGVKQVEVEVAFEPPWDSSRMSDAARLQLGIL